MPDGSLAKQKCPFVSLNALESTITFNAEYQTGKYSAYYCPQKIAELCSPETFSSAFMMLSNLYHVGALVVGTPSALAGNYFRDILSFRLNHSGLSGRVFHKYFIFFPDDPEMGRVLMPHYVLP